MGQMNGGVVGGGYEWLRHAQPSNYRLILPTLSSTVRTVGSPLLSVLVGAAWVLGNYDCMIEMQPNESADFNRKINIFSVYRLCL